MTKARGILALNTVRFVRENYGPEAHERILARLAPAQRATFQGAIRESSWKPLADIIAYMKTAQELLAPGDPDFHRRLGSFSGRAGRIAGGFLPMVTGPTMAIRMSAILWRSYYDQGHLEVTRQGPRRALVRIHDFPADRAYCARMCGGWEGLIGTEQVPVHVEEVSCALDGNSCCEMRMTW